MNQLAARFITEIAKPWELLNRDLSQPFSVDANTNDFIARANALAVAINHLPEASVELRPEALAAENSHFEIMRDVADSYKHGADVLRDPRRKSRLTIGAMFERNPEALVRFLRNRITIQHESHKNQDFMDCSMKAAKFVERKLNPKVSWSPEMRECSGGFSDEIKVIASSRNHVQLSQMRLEFVQRNPDGSLLSVDLNGSVKFTLLVEG